MMEQRSPEWFAARCGLATASNFADIMAKLKSGGEAATRKQYRARLVVERLTGKPLDTFTNVAMQQGIEREPFARAAYEAETGNFVQEVGFVRLDDMDAGCSPDGLIDEDGLVEIKCPTLATHLEYLQIKEAPALYVPQVQGQLWVTGRQWCDWVSFNPDFPEHLQLVIHRVHRHEPYIKELESEIRRFLEEVAADVQSLAIKEAA